MSIRAQLVCVAMFASATSTGCGANTRHLPVANATIVHACAAAEANAWMSNGGGTKVTKTTISVAASGEIGVSAKAGVDSTATAEAGAEATKGSEKVVTVELESLPTVQQCVRWGYMRQLGEGGCLLNALGCKSATSYPPEPKPKADLGNGK